MLLGQVFERFVKETPVSVMVRGLLEKALCPKALDELFERSAKTQYTRELLFSTVVNLMSLVVCGVHPSVHAAHQASVEEIGVSVTSVYNKINGIEPSTSGELVREIAGQMEATIRHLNATMPDLLPGYRVKIIDGNAIYRFSKNRWSLPYQKPIRLLPTRKFPSKPWRMNHSSYRHQNLFLPTVRLFTSVSRWGFLPKSSKKPPG